MLEVLDTTKALYRQSSTKTLTISIPNKNITFTNGNIITESLSLKEKIGLLWLKWMDLLVPLNM